MTDDGMLALAAWRLAREQAAGIARPAALWDARQLPDS